MKEPKKEEILQLLERSDSKPMRIKEMEQKLNVPRENRSIFKKMLRSLTTEGRVKRIKGGRYVSASEKKTSETKKTSKSRARSFTQEKKSKVVGKLLKRKNRFVVLPKNDDIPKIKIEPAEGKGFKNGSLVVVEITKRNDKDKSLEGKISSVIGQSGDIRSERKSILYEYDLPLKFPRNVIKYAEKISRGDLKARTSERKDLRDILTVTIDNDDARDFDDAISIEKTRKGYKLWVSIADVSYYVKKRSPLDKEAFKRGNSYYLPQMVIPMLPEVLSNNLCSLVPREDRLTKTVEMDFSIRGELNGYKIYDSIINSDHRLTYSWVSETLSRKGKVKKNLRELVTNIKLMRELFRKLKKKRIDNGELDFDIPEADLVRDEKGEIINVVKAERNIAHGIIEEFMIAANNAVGIYLSNKGVNSLYRIHERPDQTAMIELRDSLQPIGYNFSFGKEVSPMDIQSVIFDAQNRKDKSVVNMLILKSMKRAIYSTRDDIHFGLALDKYTHFTSPIRRYPDLIVHRTIDELNSKSTKNYDQKTLDRIAEHCSVTERRSDEVEREAMDLERANLVKTRIGETFNGKIISIMPFGMFIELDRIFVEGFIPRAEMKANRRKRWFQIGDQIKVKITEADLERRRITLAFSS